MAENAWLDLIERSKPKDPCTCARPKEFSQREWYELLRDHGHDTACPLWRYRTVEGDY